MWKLLEHPNIVPLLGITPTPLQIISEWMPGGNLVEYTNKCPDANRCGLASTPAIGFEHTPTLVTSCPMSLKVFTFSTPVT